MPKYVVRLPFPHSRAYIKLSQFMIPLLNVIIVAPKETNSIIFLIAAELEHSVHLHKMNNIKHKAKQLTEEYVSVSCVLNSDCRSMCQPLDQTIPSHGQSPKRTLPSAILQSDNRT